MQARMSACWRRNCSVAYNCLRVAVPTRNFRQGPDGDASSKAGVPTQAPRNAA